MRVKTLRIWNKGKPLWLSLIAWAVISAVMLILFGASLMDQRGGLAKIQPSYTNQMVAKSVQNIAIEAEGIAVEIAASVDTKKITVQLYGDDYSGQEVNLYQVEDTAHIQLNPYPVIAKYEGNGNPPQLTLRIILPKKQYHSIGLEGAWIDTSIYGLRGDKLVVDQVQGAISLQKLTIKEVVLHSKYANVEVDQCSMSYFQLDNQFANTQVQRSRFGYWNYQGADGDLLIHTASVKGTWQLDSGYGDIEIHTRRLPYDILIDANSKRGQLHVLWADKRWEQLTQSYLIKQQLHGVLGQGRNILLISSDQGNIVLEKIK